MLEKMIENETSYESHSGRMLQIRSRGGLEATADGKEAGIMVAVIFGTLIGLGLLTWLVCYCLRRTERIDIFTGDEGKGVDEEEGQAEEGSNKSHRPAQSKRDAFVIN